MGNRTNDDIFLFCENHIDFSCRFNRNDGWGSPGSESVQSNSIEHQHWRMHVPYPIRCLQTMLIEAEIKHINYLRTKFLGMECWRSGVFAISPTHFHGFEPLEQEQRLKDTSYRLQSH